MTVLLSRGVLACSLLAPAASAQALLDSARRYVSADEGEFQYLGDFDVDGDTDVVRFVLAGDGWTAFQLCSNDGGELTLGESIPFPAGGAFVPAGPREMEDVTGDGRPDVLALDAAAGLVLVYPSSGAPGEFGAPLSIAWAGASHVALGNVDLDPSFELAVFGRTAPTTDRDRIVWLDWDGAGFTAGAALDTTVPRARHSVALDVDGDGDDDLVCGLTNRRSMRVHLTAGGAAGAGVLRALPLESNAVLHVEACDLDGGLPDVLVFASDVVGERTIVPMRNVGGTLVPGVAQTVAAGDPDGFRAGDWDGDGDVDVVHCSGSRASFYENQGAEVFALDPAATADHRYDGPDSNAARGRPVGLLDLDGDGRLDLVGAQAVQLGRGRFVSSQVTLMNVYQYETPRAVVDREGDGDLDLVIGQRIFENDGSGAFPTASILPPLPPQISSRSLAGIGDFSGDGEVDFLHATYFHPSPFDPPVFLGTVLYASHLGGFEARPASASNLTTGVFPLAHDLDQDGSLDLVGRWASGGFWPNGGAGSFAAFTDLFGPATPAAIADLDGDGRPEVLTTGSALTCWRNQGALAFAPAPVFGGAVEPTSVSLADHDADGDLDVAFWSPWSEELRLHRNDGGASFSPSAVLATGLLPGPGGESVPTHLVFEDVDADGHTDLFGGSSGTPGSLAPVLFFRGLGGGAFGPARPYAGGATGPAGDLDGDGDGDLSGYRVVRSLRFDGEQAGAIRQVGEGTPGTGGSVPILGASGPLRSGSASASIRVRRGRGGASLLLLFTETTGGSQPLVAGTRFRLGAPSARAYRLGGSAGVAGAGTLDVDLSPHLAPLAGRSFRVQAVIRDPLAARGHANTNVLELTFAP